MYRRSCQYAPLLLQFHADLSLVTQPAPDKLKTTIRIHAPVVDCISVYVFYVCIYIYIYICMLGMS